MQQIANIIGSSSSAYWFDRDNIYIDLNMPHKKLVFLPVSVIVMCANSTTIREILLAAEELGMVDSGEYVFFSIELSSR